MTSKWRERGHAIAFSVFVALPAFVVALGSVGLLIVFALFVDISAHQNFN